MKFKRNWSHIYASQLAAPPLETNRSRQNVSSIVMIVDYFSHLWKKDLVVELEEVEGVSLLVSQAVSIGVKAEVELAIVLENFLQSDQLGGAVNREQPCNAANNDLIDLASTQQMNSMTEHKSNQIYDLINILSVYIDELAKLIRSVRNVLFQSLHNC